MTEELRLLLPPDEQNWSSLDEYSKNEGYEAATQEAFLLHVDMESVAVTPMAPQLLATMTGHRDAHAGITPQAAGQAIKPIRGTE